MFVAPPPTLFLECLHLTPRPAGCNFCFAFNGRLIGRKPKHTVKYSQGAAVGIAPHFSFRESGLILRSKSQLVTDIRLKSNLRCVVCPQLVTADQIIRLSADEQMIRDWQPTSCKGAAHGTAPPHGPSSPSSPSSPPLPRFSPVLSCSPPPSCPSPTRCLCMVCMHLSMAPTSLCTAATSRFSLLSLPLPAFPRLLLLPSGTSSMCARAHSFATCAFRH